jgi:hypothetical protein
MVEMQICALLNLVFEIFVSCPAQTGQCGKYVDVLLLESSYPHNIFFIALSTKIMRHVEFELTAGFGNVVGEVHGA